MNGKGDKRRKYSKESEEAYLNNKLWQKKDKESKKEAEHDEIK